MRAALTRRQRDIYRSLVPMSYRPEQVRIQGVVVGQMRSYRGGPR
jgi:hypothetical protein